MNRVLAVSNFQSAVEALRDAAHSTNPRVLNFERQGAKIRFNFEGEAFIMSQNSDDAGGCITAIGHSDDAASLDNLIEFILTT